MKYKETFIMEDSTTRLIPESVGSEFRSVTDSELSNSRNSSVWKSSQSSISSDDEPETILENNLLGNKKGSREFTFIKANDGKERMVCQK